MSFVEWVKAKKWYFVAVVVAGFLILLGKNAVLLP